MRVVALSSSPPEPIAKLRRELRLPFPVVSDLTEQATTELCGGVAHCEVVLDADGVVRWASWTESWTDAPPFEDVLAFAKGLKR